MFRGVAMKFCWGGGGFIGTQIHLSQNLVSPRISATLLMVENAKFSSGSRKKMLKYHHF